MTIIAVTGMKREARIVTGPGIAVLACGGHGARLRAMLEPRCAAGARGIISIGIAGGLAPSSKPGDIVAASEIIGHGRHFATDAAWTARLRERLPAAKRASLAGSDTIVATAEEKAALFRKTGCYAADMESHIAAELAVQFCLPFAALRVVADPSTRGVPPAALIALKSDGSPDMGKILRSVALKPWQIGRLIAVARDSEIALKTLLGCVRRLGQSLAGPDFH